MRAPVRSSLRWRRSCAVLGLTTLLSVLPGCTDSPLGEFLTDLTWTIVKDIARSLPFADTTALIIDNLQKAMSEDGASGQRVGILGFFEDPSLAAKAGIGIAGKFLPDYLAQELQRRGVDVSLLNAANIVGPDGKPAVTIDANGRIVLKVDPAQLGGYDYLLSGVVGRQQEQLVMDVKMVQPTEGGKVVEVVQAAQYDPDTLSLLGVNKLMATPPGPWVRCAMDSAERLTAKRQGAATATCQIVAQPGAGNLLCVHCPSVPATSYSDADGRDWKERSVEPFKACLQVKPWSTASGPTSGTYDATLQGAPAGQVTVDGRSMAVVPGEDGRYILRGNKGDEYTITLNSTGFYHTGTRVRRRLAAYLAVDGVNSIGQSLALPSSGKKWVVESGKATDIPGWQLDDGRARRFKFVSFEDSVAVRLGAQDNVGQITAVLYAEKDQGCPSGPLCKPEEGGVCNRQDVTPYCTCNTRDGRMSCEAASSHGGCQSFASPCKCRESARGPFRACEQVKTCYTNSGSKVAMAKPSPVGGTAGGLAGARGGGVGGGGPAKAMAGAAESDASPSDLGTGEGEEIDRAVETIALELDETPVGVITLHYQGGPPAPGGAAPAQITQ